MPKVATKKSKTASKSKFNKQTYLKWYESMLLMRRFEEKCGHLYIQQKFGGFCHLYIGQEAILAGMVSAMDKDDNVITAYRDHAHPLALGTSPNVVMAELFGRITGSSKGKGGSMHMFDKSKNLFGGHGIVGGQIALGAGIAFAEKYKGTKSVTYCFMGDGATRQGILHETFNMAMTWELPVVFIIENNNYAMGTSVKRTSNVRELYQLGSAYDMPSYPVDGMTCEDVHEAIANAADHSRNGKGPVLLEMKTYRYKGHSMSDPQKYRTKKEVEDYKKEDPIQKVLDTIMAKKYATDAQIKKIQQKVKEQVEESIAFAEKSDYPPKEELYQDVYKDENYPFLKD
ncbi:MAG: pyruvate dehydrogenase (acetyl-transferring) E1 component subunit alpha [Flavobacteriales bacterium]|nr:pyruvate dehydrogenase (acetyl-transferring) E1 component subunit alpha [Flavobacteriales bacterium]